MAERLYAQHGIEGVSQAQINREAGVRNRSAINYYFGSKQDLLLAILERHESELRRERAELLAEQRAAGPLRAREMAVALVEPLRRKLQDPGAGHAYLLIAAQLVGHASLSRYEKYLATTRDSTNLYVSYFPDRGDGIGTDAFVTRSILVTGLLYHSFADYVRLGRGEDPQVPVPTADHFIEGLVAALAALIEAPVHSP